MASQNDQANLRNELKSLFGTFFQGQLVLFFFARAVKSREKEFFEEAVEDAKNVTEEDFKDQNLPFSPDMYVKLIRKTPYLVEQYPELLNQLALVRAFSSFEFLLKRSIKCILQFHPDRMGKKFRAVKQDGLTKQMKDIGKFTKQIAFLKGCDDGSGLKINLRSPDFRELQLNEIHQTRNIIVHNKAVVDAKYTKYVANPQFKEGEIRSVPDDYLFASFEVLSKAGSYILLRFLEEFCGETRD